VSLCRNFRSLLRSGLMCLSLRALPFGYPEPAVAQSPLLQTVQEVVTGTPDARETGAFAAERGRAAYCQGTSAEP